MRTKNMSVAAGAILVGLVLVACQADPGSVNPTSVSSGDVPSSSTTMSPDAVPSNNPASSMPVASNLVSSSGSSSGVDLPVLVKADGTGVVAFGMTLDQFYQKAAEMGWEYAIDESIGDYMGISVGGTTFTFWQGVFYQVYVADSGFMTEEGLRVGDSIARMKQIYGTGYELSSDDYGLNYYYANTPSGMGLNVFPMGDEQEEDDNDLVGGWTIGV